MALTDNLISYWKLDESSGNAADSVGSVTLTNNNTVTYSSAIINNGADFNGSTNYLANTSAFFDIGTSDFSVSVWFKSNGDEDGAFFCVSNSSGVRDFIVLYTTAGGTFDFQIAWSVGGNTGVEELTTGVYDDNAWHHVVLTGSNSSGKAKIEVTIDGGAEVKSKEHATRTYDIAAFNGGIYLGTMYNWSTGGRSSYLTGSIDEVGFWTRKLSSTEITQLYNSGAGLAYPFITSEIKTIGGLAVANVKTVNGLAIASVKTVNDLA